LGNLISRTVAMIIKYFGGIIPEVREGDTLDGEIQAIAQQVYTEATEKLEKLDFAAYLIATSRLISRANKYIDETAPWVLAKDSTQMSRLAAVMYNLLECIRIALILTAPAMPTLMERANRQLGLWENIAEVKWDEAGTWGMTKNGTQVAKGESLFPRIDIKSLREEENVEETKEAVAQAPEIKVETESLLVKDEFITIEDFAKIDLRVAEVIACEKMEKADKLLILQVKMGDEERTVVSGIAQHYTPEELVGKKVILVANLKPTKLRGVLSQGMILAASNEEFVDVLTVNKDIASGNRVK
jgi:methionyl-tRNA synthetase